MHEIENPIEPDLKFEIHSKGLVIRYTWALILLQVPTLFSFLTLTHVHFYLLCTFEGKCFKIGKFSWEFFPGRLAFNCLLVKLFGFDKFQLQNPDFLQYKCFECVKNFPVSLRNDVSFGKIMFLTWSIFNLNSVVFPLMSLPCLLGDDCSSSLRGEEKNTHLRPPCLPPPILAHLSSSSQCSKTFRESQEKHKITKKNNWVWRERNIMTVVVSKDWISLLKMLKYGYFVAKGLKCPDRRGWHFPSQYPIVDLSKIPSAPSSIIYLKYFPIQTSKFLTLETLHNCNLV